MTPLHFRTARPADCEAAAALVNSGYRGEASRAGWTTEADLLDGQRIDAQTLREQLARPGHALLLAEADDAGLVGCVAVERRPPDRAYFGMLTVAPTLQSGGLGRRLLAAAEEFARQEFGARLMEMVVISRRTELIAWYERRGYFATGRRHPFPAHPKFGVLKVEGLEMLEFEKRLD